MLPERVTVTIPVTTLVRALTLSPAAVLVGWWVYTWSWNSQNAPAWVQAVGSIAAILAAWFIPQLHELSKEKRKRADAHENLRWLAIRLGVQCDRMLNVLRDPATHLPFFHTINDLELWRVHHKLINDVPITDLAEMDMVLIANLRTIAAIGLALGIEVHGWGEITPEPIHHSDKRWKQASDISHTNDWVLQKLKGDAGVG